MAFKSINWLIKHWSYFRSRGPCRLTNCLISINLNANKRILVIGDSNAFRPCGGEKSWPGLLKQKDPAHLEIFNESCDGRTTRYENGELNSLHVIKNLLSKYLPLDCVVIAVGTNDVKEKYGPPSLREITDGACRLLNIIVQHGNGAEPILLTPPKLGKIATGELSFAQQRISSLAAEYGRIAEKQNIRHIDVFSIIDIATDLEPDLIHLNAFGRKKIANAVWTCLKSLGQ